MANFRVLVLAFFVALSFSGMHVAQGAARSLLQITTPPAPMFPNFPPLRGFSFPPLNGPYPGYRLPPFPSISNVPAAPGFPSFPLFSAPPAIPNPIP
ncbi:hypothetical protein PTKIN_Ptkin10aG0106800 [Pterospermum kingtungense]